MVLYKMQYTKKAAIELSMSTVVIVVLAMAMLVFGIVLINSIRKGATESVDIINDRVKGQITSLFSEEGTKIAVKLSGDKIAKVKQGERLGVAIGAETRNIGVVLPDESNLKYFLEKTNGNSASDDCQGITVLDHEFQNRIAPGTGTYRFEDVEGANGYVILFFVIDDAAPECTQRFKIHTIDTEGEIASASFRVQIISGGIFS